MLQKLCPILAGFFLASPFYIVAQNLDPLAFIKTDGVVFSVKAVGNYLYFSEYRRLPSAPASHSFFKSADVADPIHPVVVDSFMTSGLILDFDLNGNYERKICAKKIFDLNGREVANLIDRWLDAGEHQVRWNATGLANGIYLYRLQVADPAHGGAGGRAETQKLILLQ